ncbi:hypothetical protein DICVIV_02659 [Dictyocaulus viviparus]|uniref:Uncharacterized protein n=1 Tax=Dictyocaulus viviparus TaxID=29172 RepID=A0A0D8Y4U9_DICVI|nr:hypothetical protein DICVIV_02659 [Dictyocaulus viviparus]
MDRSTQASGDRLIDPVTKANPFLRLRIELAHFPHLQVIKWESSTDLVRVDELVSLTVNNKIEANGRQRLELLTPTTMKLTLCEKDE